MSRTSSLSLAVVGLAAVIAPLAGCAGQGAQDSPAPPPPAGARAGAGPSAVPPARIDGTALPQGYPREVAVANGRDLIITAQESGCVRVAARVARQDSGSVTVRLVHSQPEEAAMCTRDIRYPAVTVRLDEPLGERTVVLDAVEKAP